MFIILKSIYNRLQWIAMSFAKSAMRGSNKKIISTDNVYRRTSSSSSARPDDHQKKADRLTACLNCPDPVLRLCTTADKKKNKENEWVRWRCSYLGEHRLFCTVSLCTLIRRTICRVCVCLPAVSRRLIQWAVSLRVDGCLTGCLCVWV